MLTMPGRSGYRLLVMSFALLTGCAARPVLHEFPPPLAPAVRPDAAVRYTLRAEDVESQRWLLRGEQGDVVGDFRWRPAFRDVSNADASPDRSEDFRRDDLFQDGINGRDYIFRVSATSGSLKHSGMGTAPPRVTIFDAASGERIGELELRIGFDTRFEGDWRGRQVLWRAEAVQGGEIVRESEDGKVADTYPLAQLLQWAGGSNANLVIFSGREVVGEPEAFGRPLFDVAAGRPLTRRELGDAIVMLFAIRAAQGAQAGAVVGDDD